MLSRVCKAARFSRKFTQSHSLLAIKPFLLADVGEGIKECELIQWYIQPNARVDEFDPICEVQSDKATVEITSRYSGVIKKLYPQAGQMTQVGSPLLDIDIDEVPGAQIHENLKEQKEASTNKEEIPVKIDMKLPEQNVRSDIKSIATPAVRRLCRENSLEISAINGTGKANRVTKEDVLKYLNGTKSRLEPSNDVVELKGVARQMFNSMSKAASTPHFLYTEEIEMDNLKLLRERANKVLDIKLSFMPFMIKALSMALNQYPIANSRLIPEKAAVEYRTAHNIAIAMDTPSGLVVPSIKNCQNLSIVDIGRELIRLQHDGVENKLSPGDLTGGTITLSNIGSTGGMYVAPVIVESQVCIGGLGRIRKLPRFDENDNVVARNIMCCSWAGDHRILDGMTVALLVSRWKKLLENPDEMLLELK